MVHFVKDIEDYNAQLASANGKPIVIDFTATWCGPCKMIAPVFESLAKEFSGVVFLKVDVDDAEDVATKFEVQAMPTFVVVVNGEKKETFSGASETKLRALVEKYAH